MLNTVIWGTLFLQKPSYVSNKPTLSDAGGDYTYGEIGYRIKRYCERIRFECDRNGGDTIVVCCKMSAELVILFLAVLLLKFKLVVVPEESSGALDELIAGVSPIMVFTDHIKVEDGAPCREIDMKQLSASGSGGMNMTDFLKGWSFKLYDEGLGKSFTIDDDIIRGAFSDMELSVRTGGRSKFLIAGEIGLLAFLLESAWCILSGIHVLYFPEDPEDHIADHIHFPMDFSLFFFGSVADNPSSDEGCYDLVMKSADHADLNGYSAIWTPERHFNEFGGKFPNPGILSAAIAVRTNRIQIRTGSIVAPLHNVVRIAEDWSVVDNLSCGRVALSLAAGWHCNDFVFFPERYDRRHEIMFQQLGQLRDLWAGQKIELENGAGQKIRVAIYPRPIQQELPIWITVSSSIETFIGAGKAGANVLTHLLWQDPLELMEKIQVYRNTLAENGFDPQSRIVTIMLHTYIGKDMEEVRQKVKKPLTDYIRSSWHLVETMVASVSATHGENNIGRYGKLDEHIPEDLKEELMEIAFERFFSSAGLLGDLSHCRTMLGKLRSYGADELACLIDFGLDTPSILSGLEELSKLKAEFSETAVKRYGGAVTVRAVSDDHFSNINYHLNYDLSKRPSGKPAEKRRQDCH
jgi:natural product biosynthesis luciferase-like monooxygenase protein